MSHEYDNPDYMSYENNPAFFNWHLPVLGGMAVATVVDVVAPVFTGSETTSEYAAGVAFIAAFAGLKKFIRWWHSAEF